MSSINATDVEEVAKARLSTDLGTSLGPYIVGYGPCFLTQPVKLTEGWTTSMFFDAVLLGVCLQLFSRWYTYCSVGEKKWVKILVVRSPSCTRAQFTRSFVALYRTDMSSIT